NVEPKCPCGLEVDHKLKLSWLLNRQVGGLLAFEDAKASIARSISSRPVTSAGGSRTPNDGAVGSIERQIATRGGCHRFRRTATRIPWGAISLSTSSVFPPIENSPSVNPVMLPPGRVRLVTNPLPTGS